MDPPDRTIVGSKGSNHDIPESLFYVFVRDNCWIRRIEPWLDPPDPTIVGSKGSNHDIPKGYNCFPLENHDCASFGLLLLFYSVKQQTATIIVGSKGSNHDIPKGYNCFLTCPVGTGKFSFGKPWLDPKDRTMISQRDIIVF